MKTYPSGWQLELARHAIDGLLWDIGQAVAALDWLADFTADPELAEACRARVETLRREYAAVEAMQRATVKQTA